MTNASAASPKTWRMTVSFASLRYPASMDRVDIVHQKRAKAVNKEAREAYSCNCACQREFMLTKQTKIMRN